MIAPAGVNVDDVAGQNAALGKALRLQHRLDILRRHHLARFHRLSFPDMGFRVEQHGRSDQRRRLLHPELQKA